RFVARYADLWDGGGTPEEYAATAARLHALCREIGRDPGAIRQVLSTGPAPLESSDQLRAHVAAYAQIGVRSFLFDAPYGPISDALRRLSAETLPALRQEFAAGRLV
ncbi:MAG TPA: hypothetical protein VFI42_19670, partial [Thermomicrobiaceae bacterium]|nr:hypothetical protein [Thermomicrobiaceae bacterium]